jgi:rare lipoprotein A
MQKFTALNICLLLNECKIFVKKPPIYADIESMKKIMFVFVLGLSLGIHCFAQARAGEVNRGFFYQEGIASWYGREFNGRSTASGEIFNDSLLTAAHPILPFGTLLKVTNQHNNKSVTVKVNDRGPFVAERILDLSRAAAEQLDMISTGTAPIRVESLHEVSLPARPVQNAPAQTPQPVLSSELPAQNGQMVQVRPASAEPFSGTQTTQPAVNTGIIRFQPANPEYSANKNYKIQVGAYTHPEHALEAYEKLKQAGFNPSYEPYGDYYRVVIGGLKQEELKVVSDRLGTIGFKEILLKEER